MAKIEKHQDNIGGRAETGEAGEEVVFLYLKRNGYKTLERNYENKFGEIDIIAFKPSGLVGKLIGGRQRGTVVFVEVKTRKIDSLAGSDPAVRGQTPSGSSELYPEQNVDWQKQRKLIRASEGYLIENNYPDDTDWQIDVIGVELDEVNRLANLRHLKRAVFL